MATAAVCLYQVDNDGEWERSDLTLQPHSGDRLAGRVGYGKVNVFADGDSVHLWLAGECGC